MHDNANITFIYPFILPNPQNIKIQNKSIVNPIKNKKTTPRIAKLRFWVFYIFKSIKVYLT